MKKLLAIIILAFLALSGQAQIKYPHFDTDSLGQRVVVLTVKQAQALDNSTDLVPLFKKLNGQIGDYDTACLKVVRDKDSVISSLTVEKEKLKERVETKEKEVKNLESDSALAAAKIASLERTIALKEKEISTHKTEIKRVKKRAFAAGGVAGVVVSIIVAALVK